MGIALTLILVACAALIVWAFITGRVSAARRRTYLPPSPPNDEPPAPREPGADQP